MSAAHPVVWERELAFVGQRRPSAVHLALDDEPERTLCGLEVPPLGVLRTKGSRRLIAAVHRGDVPAQLPSCRLCAVLGR